MKRKFFVAEEASIRIFKARIRTKNMIMGEGMSKLTMRYL
jgi:hypothetical protein